MILTSMPIHYEHSKFHVSWKVSVKIPYYADLSLMGL